MNIFTFVWFYVQFLEIYKNIAVSKLKFYLLYSTHDLQNTGLHSVSYIFLPSCLV